MDNPQRDPYILVTQFNFDDMHLPVGDRFQLESLADLGQFHYGALLGFSEGQSVLVNTPFVDGPPMPYTDGQALTARAFAGWGFFRSIPLCSGCA